MPVSVSPTAYAGVEDLRHGDLPLPAYVGDGAAYINEATDEIDSMIGHLYVTPLIIEDVPANRPTLLLLKRMNWLIASGRLILDIAAAGENANLNAYGNSMLSEGRSILSKIMSGDIVLAGAERISTDVQSFTGPVIFNEDSQSLVQAYYDNYNTKNLPAEYFPGQHVLDPYNGTV